ncbi:hypothetical protein IKP85_00220 [bacterium]|nr:hypothetical protein [bacterium]
MGLDAVNSTPQAQQPQQKPGKGPADLAKALGITEDQLKKMSQQEVEKLAKEKKVKLEEYGRPGQPPQQPQNGQKQPNSVFKP